MNGEQMRSASMSSLVNEFGFGWPEVEHCGMATQDVHVHRSWKITSIQPVWSLGPSTPCCAGTTLTIQWTLDQRSRVLRFSIQDQDRWINRIALSTGMHTANAGHWLGQLVGELSEVQAFLDERIFTLEGNWLLKRWNVPLTGLLRCFSLWLACDRIPRTHPARKVLVHCFGALAPEFDITAADRCDRFKVMAMFAQNFHRCRNDERAYLDTLSTPEVHARSPEW